MRTQTNKAVWRQAQTLSMIAFAAMASALWGLWTLLAQLKGTAYHDILEGAVYVAGYFAIFTVRPMTNYFYSRLTRR